jgi:predicted RNA-binding Zn ribbon-like protein
MTGEGPLVVIAGLDEGVLERERRLPQPGGREAAPGELALLQSFINSHFDLVEDWGADLLASPQRLLDWFSARRLLPPGARLPTPAQVQDVIDVREGLRALAGANRMPPLSPKPAAVRAMNRVAAGLSIRLELDDRRLVLSAAGPDGVDAGVGTLLAIATRAMIDGRWRRLKCCPGEHCGWAFYDHSRNNSSRWCSMAVCGGRTKARAHYRRQRGRTRGNE